MACKVVGLVLIVMSCAAKKDFKVEKDFLEKEKNHLASEKSVCSLKKISPRALDNIRLTKKASAAIPCYVDALLEDIGSWKKWTILGNLYQKNADTKSNTCFKISSKLLGPINTFIHDWSFIGPFVIGKVEWDGDPLEAFGGISNVSKFRYRKNEKFYTELVKDTEITWQILKQTSKQSGLQISPTVSWNDLVNSLGSMGITEWQGWVVGEIFINEDDQNVLLQCLGIHTVYVDDVPVTSDVYHRDQYWFGVNLSRGVHNFYVRLRTKVTASIRCSFKTETVSVKALSPHFLPDLLNGYVFSKYISVPVCNYHHSKWVRMLKVSSSQLDVSLLSSFNIAPGQTTYAVVLIDSKNNLAPDCSIPEFQFTLKFVTTEGALSLSLALRCRKSGQSFLFTFLDHDASVQHAAAVQPITDCDLNLCPVLLTLHGTTVPPQNQADSYKRMVNGEFIFGADKAWLLAPTRHGAHNWEGPGLLTALSALTSLAEYVQQHDWIDQKIDRNRIVYAGHSMGGHGAWHLASHYPDRGLALVTLAGWIKKEEYGDSNLFFRHDVAASHVDPATKFIMEACIAENDADRHISNIQDIPVLARIGADDRTVHPFFVRRMHRLLQEIGASINYTEISKKEHWWWDTWETNDGGVVNDKQIRDFTNTHLSESTSHCQVVDGQTKCSGDQSNMYSRNQVQKNFTLTTYNPALGEGLYGVQILKQIVPMRTSKIMGTISDDVISLKTVNVAKISITEPPVRKTSFNRKNIVIDKQIFEKENHKESSKVYHCLKQGLWTGCSEDTENEREKDTYGPARRVAEHEFIIVIGTQGVTSSTWIIHKSAVYIANLFFLTSDTHVHIYKDVDIDINDFENKNLIIIGNAMENLLTKKFLDKLPIKHEENTFDLGTCQYDDSRVGLLTLAPHGNKRLALLLLGNSVDGLKDVVSLATPTIPPMTRSPFSNLLPDYIITGPDTGLKGPGGFLCAGFYGNKWEYRTDTSSCIC